MGGLVRRVLGVLFGLAAAVFGVWCGELALHRFFPPPAIDFKDSAAVEAMIRGMSATQFLALLGVWLLAAFLGGAVATIVAGRGRRLPAWIVGFLFLGATLMNLFLLPGHPWWVWLGAIFLIVPMAVSGGRIASGQT